MAPAVLAALLAVPEGSGAQEPSCSVRFVSPRNRAMVLGPTELRLAIDGCPEGAAVRLELTVDGKALVSLTTPPWTATWDAGDAKTGHRIKALALFPDGTRAEALLETTALRIDQVEQVELVNLYAIVRAPEGRYVTDLDRGDFRLLESGRQQVIQRFTNEHRPLNIAIVLDTSLSMKKGDRLDAARHAALNFLDVLEPEDQAMVVPFSDEPHVPDSLTSDRGALAAVIRNTQARGGTALYDAIWHTAGRLREFAGRRVIVLLSDGKDEAASGLEPGSLHTLGEALDQALRSEAMIFAIGLGHELQELDFHKRETVAAILTRLAEETGGRVIFLTRAGQLAKAFQDVALDLRHQYSLAYASSDPRRDGKWRPIELSVPGTNYEVITRKGYFAPGGERRDGGRSRSR